MPDLLDEIQQRWHEIQSEKVRLAQQLAIAEQKQRNAADVEELETRLGMIRECIDNFNKGELTPLKVLAEIEAALS